MAQQKQTVIIPKENAVFWMDGNGKWHNEHGEFEHAKIISYFHSSIRKDENGFYLIQERDDMIEKVYFPYEETAFFVFDVIKNDEITLMLNTGENILFEPEHLSIKDDQLYMENKDSLIKFSERGLLKISDMIVYENDKYYMKVKDIEYEIKER